MIAVTSFAGMRVAVFGLGGSGLATARALIAGEAKVTAWDDSSESLEKAAAEGIPTQDLKDADFSAFAALVLAPGVPLTHPKPHWVVEKAKAAEVEIIGDIELFARERRKISPASPFIAITGTNGKSTTTALIAHMLKAAGRDVQMGGNIGMPILSLDPLTPDRVYVIECSSYQIDLAPTVDPTVAVLLNLTEDHLDRHGTMEHYAEVKERLVQRAGLAVIGVDDNWSASIADRRAASGLPLKRISTKGSVKDGVWAIGQRVVEPFGLAQTVIIDLSQHPVLRGAHNAQNTAAAVAATRGIHIGLDEVRSGIMSFPGLAHRMEPIGKIGSVTIVNDSKATNSDAAGKALSSYPRIHWIAGGKPKTGGIEDLAPFFPRIAKAYLIGEAAEAFAKTLEGKVPYEICQTLDVAVPMAIEEAATEGGGHPSVVLLSPACASFDQYRNFEVRGDAFRALALAVDGVVPFPEVH
ncbi:UDP-N-acetylmuramoylalanine-D-glutamate ligase [Hartmannibacter diazotrophicus]|uniref:UDP-N-acetylmuramoylalanine--D-glutamate ligase n=1 Tax=Hartmannibacter diazotrophicus TaxID=1482074 RepID=A0A2C9D8L4_9HYPH|nr:UDP-N-acetylmuramoyl-L-alanine--D-glutamate ligase [Hartmannibacter diazotrophicus]SON56520.1 UDP-N-acetylmuramoylalanine-D-glutamate ligase [Hartmannibacter diazotrophicus]